MQDQFNENVKQQKNVCDQIDDDMISKTTVNTQCFITDMYSGP